jgi:hypothetical protein
MFEVLRALTVKNTVFWYVMVCSLAQIYHLEGTQCKKFLQNSDTFLPWYTASYLIRQYYGCIF